MSTGENEGMGDFYRPPLQSAESGSAAEEPALAAPTAFPGDPRFNPPVPPDSDPGDGGTQPGDRRDSGEMGAGEARVSGLPVSFPRDETLHRTVEICRRALLNVHANADAPHVYAHNGNCAVLADNGGGGKIIREIRANQAGTAELKVILSRLVRFASNSGRRSRPLPPPNDVVLDILAHPGDLPRLEKIVDLPTFRADGSLLEVPGYDVASGLFYAPGENAGIRALKAPTPEEVAAAVEAVKRPFAEFPFWNEAGRTDYLAALLTPFARPLIAGNVPLIAITSPVQGSGKSKLATAVSWLASGGTDSLMTAPEREDDEELRKRLTAKLLQRPAVVVVDNITGRLRSASLAALLTTNRWSDRRLGRSEMVTVPVDALFVTTGVNLLVADDLLRRTILISLDPASEQPWRRQFAFDPEDYVRGHRSQLVTSLLALIRNWLAKGRPAWSGNPPGSFEAWARTVGGIVETAGLSGFLENLDSLDDAANREAGGLARFYAAWVARFDNRGVRSAEVVEALKGNTEAAKNFQAGLLDEMQPIIDLPEGRAATRLTAILRRFKDRVAGDLRLTQRHDAHAKIYLWQVMSVTSAEPAAGTAGIKSKFAGIDFVDYPHDNSLPIKEKE